MLSKVLDQLVAMILRPGGNDEKNLPLEPVGFDELKPSTGPSGYDKA